MLVCAFCEDPAYGPCKWPVERFDETEVGSLKEGDIVRRYQDSMRQDWSVATVENLSKLENGLIRVTLSIRGKNWAVRGKTFEANDFQRCRRRVMRPCGVLACEKHLAIRGPGVYHCWDHIRSWEQVA